jgi:hypothetical protein
LRRSHEPKPGGGRPGPDLRVRRTLRRVGAGRTRRVIGPAQPEGGGNGVGYWAVRPILPSASGPPAGSPPPRASGVRW